MDLSLGLEGTHVLITGGAGHIGKVVVQALLAAGARVTSVDISHGQSDDALPIASNTHLELRGDVSSENSIKEAFRKSKLAFGTPSCVISLAALDLSVLTHHESAADIPVEQFRRTLEVNVLGTFILAKHWLDHLTSAWRQEELRNVSFIIVGSESGHWGEAHNADYATSKSAVQHGLLQSLRQDAPRIWPGARVNAIAPGPVNTPRFPEECAANPSQYYEDCVATTALARPVEMEHVARSILYLASERFSGAVHGQILNVDSGKVGKLVYKKGEKG